MIHDHRETDGVCLRGATPLLIIVSVVILAFGPPRLVYKAAHVITGGLV